MCYLALISALVRGHVFALNGQSEKSFQGLRNPPRNANLQPPAAIGSHYIRSVSDHSSCKVHPQ